MCMVPVRYVRDAYAAWYMCTVYTTLGVENFATDLSSRISRSEVSRKLNGPRTFVYLDHRFTRGKIPQERQLH